MIGVILAGGRSSRMGADKATIALAGRPMIEWVAQALEAVCDKVVVAGRSTSVAGLTAIPDRGEGHRGPLAGIAASAELGSLLVVGVDQPWVRFETIGRLIAVGGDIPVVPVDQGNRQATCAIYPAGVGEAAQDELDSGGSVQTLLDRVAFRPVAESEWRSWGEDGRSWFSANSPDDILSGLERYGPPQPPM